MRDAKKEPRCRDSRAGLHASLAREPKLMSKYSRADNYSASGERRHDPKRRGRPAEDSRCNAGEERYERRLINVAKREMLPRGHEVELIAMESVTVRDSPQQQNQHASYRSKRNPRARISALVSPLVRT